jgi:hypothetical protein
LKNNETPKNGGLHYGLAANLENQAKLADSSKKSVQTKRKALLKINSAT